MISETHSFHRSFRNQVSKAGRWGTCLGVGLVLCLTVGCATAPSPPRETPLDLAMQQRGVVPQDVEVPFQLDAEMRQWVRQRVSMDLDPSERLDALAELLLDGEALELEYSWGTTGTARQVFDSGQANCLAFTNLFLAMARELDVPVYFLAVETETFRRHGELIVVSDHIAVGHGPGPEIQMYDFAPREGSTLREVRRISDVTALAKFYSNRGAEALQSKDLTAALDALRLAVRLEPNLAAGWLNLGVARRWSGDVSGAEQAYHRALEIDPTVYAGYQNLISLWTEAGRHDEAQRYAKILGKTPDRNPYTFISLGDRSLRHGRLAEAKRFYRWAATLEDGSGESYAALGQLAAVRGDWTKARRMLRKAQRLGEDNERTRRLAQLVASPRVAEDG